VRYHRPGVVVLKLAAMEGHEMFEFLVRRVGETIDVDGYVLEDVGDTIVRLDLVELLAKLPDK
jgi:hypothetical protein